MFWGRALYELSEAVNFTMTWGRTPEGHGYWSTLRRYFYGLAGGRYNINDFVGEDIREMRVPGHILENYEFGGRRNSDFIKGCLSFLHSYNVPVPNENYRSWARVWEQWRANMAGDAGRHRREHDQRIRRIRGQSRMLRGLYE